MEDQCEASLKKGKLKLQTNRQKTLILYMIEQRFFPWHLKALYLKRQERAEKKLKTNPKVKNKNKIKTTPEPTYVQLP